MKLIDNWRQWPRMYSQWAFATIGGIQASVLTFMTKAQLDAPVLFYPSLNWGDGIAAVTTALAVSGFVGRLIAQDLPPAPPNQA